MVFNTQALYIFLLSGWRNSPMARLALCKPEDVAEGVRLQKSTLNMPENWTAHLSFYGKFNYLKSTVLSELSNIFFLNNTTDMLN